MLLSMLTTNQKGWIAETAVVHECAKLGVPVAKPFDDQRYDLILDCGARLLRVQCKWAARNGDVVIVRLYSARRAREGLRRSFYSSAEIDAFAAYCDDIRTCYFLRLEDVARSEIRLRLGPTLNNQSKGVHWAKDHEFAARLKTLLGP
jgi:PD-(D/E)XK nuclease superfamily protein